MRSYSGVQLFWPFSTASMEGCMAWLVTSYPRWTRQYLLGDARLLVTDRLSTASICSLFDTHPDERDSKAAFLYAQTNPSNLLKGLSPFGNPTATAKSNWRFGSFKEHFFGVSVYIILQ
ncbi:hypothetical protein CC80DRAFT_291711 [Byssothecium circinans]|uniref:Uncharacterized protein n=1 Tax=Byssothecium circinans TaxID=147558 RepID=A0A6A5U6M3_9PLEO|nr:hypothetical protein CC80DRAFT_291711 [Byssothecium circinans]